MTLVNWNLTHVTTAMNLISTKVDEVNFAIQYFDPSSQGYLSLILVPASQAFDLPLHFPHHPVLTSPLQKTNTNPLKRAFMQKKEMCANQVHTDLAEKCMLDNTEGR